MALIAKRKVGASWREAVAARAGALEAAEACLSDFDARIAAGAGETEAAYRALQGANLLWRVELPGDPASSAPAAPEADVPVA